MEKRLDVLLVSPPSPNPLMLKSFKRQGMPPLGLGYIATYLKQADYSVAIMDMGLEDNTMDVLLDTIKTQKPSIVGISCSTETYNTTIRIAKIIKEINGDICIALGGPHVSLQYNTIFGKENIIDFAMINEGEISFKKLCDYYIRKTLNLEDLRSVVYVKKGKTITTPLEPFIEDLDSLPFPDRSLFDPLDKYAIPATISTSRGCPGKCAFCAAGVLSGGRYRMRSAKNVVDEFQYLQSLGYNHVTIVDDTMTVNKKRLYEFADELIARKVMMTWYCESRIDVITREMLIKMKAAGLTEIQFGVESGNQNVLDNINKGILLDKVYTVFKWCKEMHIHTITNLIIGQPSDTKETIKETIALGEQLIDLGAQLSFTICTPFPGTPLWEKADEYGIEIVDYDLDHYSTYHPVYNTRYLTAKEIRNEFYNAFKIFDK